MQGLFRNSFQICMVFMQVLLQIYQGFLYRFCTIFHAGNLDNEPATCSRLRKPSQVKTVPVGETPPYKISS